jgi:hypothetical protein
VGDFLKDTFSAFTGGALSAATGLWLFWIQRRIAAKDDFLASIEDLRVRLDFLQMKPEAFYAESVEILRNRVYKVRRHLRKEQRAELHTILRDYENEKDWFESPHKVITLIAYLKSEGVGAPSPQMFLGSFLNRFEACVTKQKIDAQLLKS